MDARTHDASATDIGTHKLFLTVFKDKTASALYHGASTLPEWRDQILAANADAKANLFWLKGARFGNIKSKHGSYRTNVNLTHLTAIVVEHDAGTISFDEALAILTKAGARALIYTSPSHATGNQRWRVILPLSCDVPKTRHEVLVATVNGLFGGALSSESFVLSQSYYFGSVNHNPEHRCEIIDGKFLDLADRLYAGSIFSDGSRVGDDSPLQRVRNAHNEAGHVARLRNDLPDDPAKVAFALSQISSDIPYYPKLKSDAAWMMIGAALASEIDHDEGFEIFDAWSKTSRRYDAAKIVERWDAFCEMSFIGIGTLYHFATEANPNWRKEWKAQARGDNHQEEARAKARSQADAEWADAKPFEGWLNKGVEALPDGISARCKTIVAHVGTIDNLNTDLKRAIGGKKHETLANLDEIVVALAVELLEFGPVALPVEQVAAALLCDLKCNAPITRLPNETQRRKAADRTIYSARTKIAASQRSDSNPDDRVAGDNSGAKTEMHAMLTSVFMERLQQRGEDLRVVADKNGDESIWRCNPNQLWELLASPNAKIEGDIEVIARSLGIITNDEMVRLTRNYILRSPEVRPTKDKIRIEFDVHGKIAVRGQLIDPRTMETEKLTKEHYATQTLDVEYDPGAECPWWLKGLESAFADRPNDVMVGTIGLLQDMAGMTLVLKKDKALSKALIFLGKSNSGKTTLAETIARMSSDHPIATSLEAISGPHGLQEFAYSNAPWLLHEAFGKGWVPGQKIKDIISGDWVGINIKNGPLLTKRILNPIIWCTNAPVQISEASSAVRNRIIIIDCRMEFKENHLVGVGAEAKRLGFENPHDFLLAHEKAGIFNWMLEGMRRALERGHFINTAEGESALDEFRSGSNRVASFLDECVSFGPSNRIRIADFSAAFGLHWEDNKDSKHGTPSNDTISRDLIEMGDDCIGVNTKELRDSTHRFYVGMHLNRVGLAYWEAATKSDRFSGVAKTVRTSLQQVEVNRSIPNNWNNCPTVRRVKAADFTAHDQIEKSRAAEANADAKAETDAETAEAAARPKTKF